MTTTIDKRMEFGRIAQLQESENNFYDTKSETVSGSESFKIIQQRDDGTLSSGYRKINYAEQKREESYRRINRMLGGN